MHAEIQVSCIIGRTSPQKRCSEIIECIPNRGISKCLLGEGSDQSLCVKGRGDELGGRAGFSTVLLALETQFVCCK